MPSASPAAGSTLGLQQGRARVGREQRKHRSRSVSAPRATNPGQPLFAAFQRTEEIAKHRRFNRASLMRATCRGLLECDFALFRSTRTGTRPDTRLIRIFRYLAVPVSLLSC